MAKILAVFHGIPSGTPGDPRALNYELCRRLLETGHDIHLALLLTGAEERDTSALVNDGFKVYTHREDGGGIGELGRWALNTGLSALTMSVLQAFQFNPGGFRYFIRGLIADGKYRLVQFNHWLFYRGAYNLGTRRLLVMPYYESLYLERLTEMAQNPVEETIRSTRSSYRKKGELNAFGYFEHLACFSGAEADAVTAVRNKKPIVIPPTIKRPEDIKPDYSSATVAFPFDASRKESEQSLRWFRKYVWPGLKSEISGIKLVIGGAVPDNIRESFTGRDVEYKPRMQEAMNGAALTVLPSFANSGVRTEAVAALYCGLPLVASPIILEALPEPGPENGIYPALYAGDFAAAINRILGDKPSAEEAGRKAGEYAARTYSPENRRPEIATIYETFLR